MMESLQIEKQGKNCWLSSVTVVNFEYSYSISKHMYHEHCSLEWLRWDRSKFFWIYHVNHMNQDSFVHYKTKTHKLLTMAPNRLKEIVTPHTIGSKSSITQGHYINGQKRELRKNRTSITNLIIIIRPAINIWIMKKALIITGSALIRVNTAMLFTRILKFLQEKVKPWISKGLQICVQQIIAIESANRESHSSGKFSSVNNTWDVLLFFSF